MARRTFQQADKGQLYCIDWPEWHVECAEPGCDATTLVSPVGMDTTLRQAEKRANSGQSDMENGWEKRDGLWYCPEHTEE